MKRNLFLRKPLQAHVVPIDESHPHALKKHLGWFQLMVIGIGVIIGAGIFVVTGKAAAEYAGPAIILSFIISAVICLFAGLCYAELSSLIPASGGSYSYSYVTLGEWPAWMIGWAVTGQYLMAASTVAAGWGSYFQSFFRNFGLTIPDTYVGAPFAYHIGSGWSMTGNFLNLPALLLVLFIGAMLCIGIKAVARFTSIMVLIKLATIVLFVLVGLPHIQSENWHPFIPENTGVFGEFGWSGIIRAVGLVFFAYIGFDMVATLAQDAKNPQKDLPRGILGSLIVCTAAYIIVSLVLTGIVHYNLLDVSDPIAVALDTMGPRFIWLALVVKFAILAGLASGVLVIILAQTRVFLAMSSDGLLPPSLSKIHPKSKTPLFNTYLTTVIAALLSGLFPIEILAQLVSMVTLFIFAIVCLAVWILRHTHPEFKRPFKVPLVPWVPILGILCCVAQMFCLPAVTWLQLILWLIIGSIVYFTYSIKHSRIRKEHSAAKD